MLNNLCYKHDERFKDIEDDCVELVSYGVQARYPYEMMIEERDMKEAIESARRIKNFIEQRMN
ncbi:MAG: HEPN domain-containing protein [Cellulosilyticaceae bacterium]